MKMKKVLSFLTAAAMTASCAVGMAVTANAAVEDDYPHIVDFTKFDTNASTTLSDSVINDTDGTKLLTVEYPGTWKVNKGISPVDNDNRPSQSNKIYSGGCAVIFTAEKNGTVLVDRKLGNNKTLDIDDLTTSEEIISFKNGTGASIMNTTTVESDVAIKVTAGHRYAAYVTGTGDPFYGIYYKVATADPSISVSPAKKTISLGETTKITATLENADNETVVWSTDNNKVATVEDGIVTAVGVGTANITAAITVNGTEYKAISEITVVDNATITYSIGDSAAEGEAPKAVTVVKGENVTIPKNDKLYVEGKTLTKWTDGTNDYLPGQAYALNDNVTVTPVFEENTVELGDAETTVNYDFQTKNGASVFELEGKTGIIVGQAEINGKTIDVKMNINTAPGKFNNSGLSDWAQVNKGTTFTVSVLKGSVVTVGDVYDNAGEYTINGVAKVGNNGSETADADGTMDIVSTNGGYWRSISVTYPEAEKIVEPTINKTKVVTATDNESADPAVAFKYEIKPGTNTITKLTWTATAGTATNKITKDVELSGDAEYTYGLVVVLNSESAKAAGADAVNSSLEVE